ncbi:MAG: hypothetical protein MI749_16290, partial [Desulfovibrionales bacterium]|nr:hypothetical protein [Desulfovibrionales bacterium]
MKELNVKIVEFETDLKLFTKRIRLYGNELSAKQIQSVCSQIARKYKIAAIPYNLATNEQELLIYQYDNLPNQALTIDNWSVTVKSDNSRFILDFHNVSHRQLIADLYKRSLIIRLNQHPDFWVLDSPRIFYEKEPLVNDTTENSDIDAFRRYEISDVIIDDVGLGFSVDISTAFFTNLSVDDYMNMGHIERFKKLSGRQGEQQGTLLYDGPNKKVKCYFVKYEGNLTLSTAHAIRMNDGSHYNSPFEYFQDRYPDFSVKSTDRVAKVSFPGMNGPVDVAANRLFLRVMNNMLPNNMRNIDKISASDRENLLTNGFWGKLGIDPFGKGFRNVIDGYHQPEYNRSGTIPLPDLKFGNGSVLKAPEILNAFSYKDHFRKRKSYLNNSGCYHVPPQMQRRILISYPSGFKESIVEKYSDDLCKKISELTKVDVEPVVMPAYGSILDAAYRLQDETDNGMVLFLFNSLDPASYYHIRRELKDWKLKRATTSEMLKKYNGLKTNYKNRGRSNWESYIELTAYDVVEELGCIPFVFDTILNYDMQLVIDVSEKSSHFGLSLMLYNGSMKIPLFPCRVHAKSDPKNKETINRLILEKYLTNLFLSLKLKLERFKPHNLLVLRDGRDCGEE